jgi:ribose 5-phosphate isomerase B
MKILLASDHAGFELKNKVKNFLVAEGFQVEDMGAHALVPNDNYPEIMVPVAVQMLKEAEGNVRAIIFGMSGQGEAMISNRFPGIRATVYYGGHNLDIIRLSREHNDANILSIGAHFVDESEAKEVVKLWLSTAFSGDERHVKRIEQMDNIQ